MYICKKYAPNRLNRDKKCIFSRPELGALSPSVTPTPCMGNFWKCYSMESEVLSKNIVGIFNKILFANIRKYIHVYLQKLCT